MNPEIVQNSDMALQDHCSYKAPTTNHHIKQTIRYVLRYCVLTVSGTACLVSHCLLRIKYSAFCKRCSEFWNSVSGKNTTEFYWRWGFSLFSSGLKEDGRSSTAVTPNYGKAYRNEVATSATTRRNAGPRATDPRTSRTRTCWHEGCVSTPCEAPSVGTCLTASDHMSHFNFYALWFYFGAVEGLLVAVSHLHESSCCSRWPKGSGFSQPQKRRQGKSTILQWIRSWRTWRCNLIQCVSSSGNVSSTGWTTMQRRPGESIQELAARIRQAAATCDFASIADSLDQWFSNCVTRTTSGTRGLFRWYANSFPVIFEQLC